MRSRGRRRDIRELLGPICCQAAARRLRGRRHLFQGSWCYVMPLDILDVCKGSWCYAVAVEILDVCKGSWCYNVLEHIQIRLEQRLAEHLHGPETASDLREWPAQLCSHLDSFQRSQLLGFVRRAHSYNTGYSGCGFFESIVGQLHRGMGTVGEAAIGIIAMQPRVSTTRVW